MLIDMIRMPAMDQLVETVVLDIPSGVAPMNHRGGRDDRRRQSGDPDPLTGLGRGFSALRPSHRISFLRAHHAHRLGDLRPGGETAHVPPEAVPRPITAVLRRHETEEPAGILVEV